ncbi:hypothetical protein CPB83DRAFT_904988 [Crepidotus variabilis]|uniref:Uncharacterized protein n=1 Tax=Crepidotus variabilis TaxID=179855 RepID=A0A9P6EJR6_9AGAR|nr:hypothetical protein CPB83DRAFT_904988 [Crepidotus variabilis]
MTIIISSSPARSFMTIDTKIASLGRPRSNSKASSIYARASQSAKTSKYGFDTISAPSPLSASFKDVSFWKTSVVVPLSPSHARQKPPLPTRAFQILCLPPSNEPHLHPENYRKRKRSPSTEEAPLSPLFYGQNLPFVQRSRTPPPAYTETEYAHPIWDEHNSSLLFSVDRSARRGSPRKPRTTLQATISNAVPAHLSAVLSGIEFEHRVIDQSLSISLYEGPCSDLFKPKNEVYDSSICEVTSLCITVGQRLEEYGPHAINAVWSFIVWFLAWTQSTRQVPLDDIHLSVPEAFDSLHPNQSIHSFIGKKPIIDAHTLSWVGGVGALSYLLQFCSPEGIQELQVISELSMDDALILLRYLSRFKIHTLSIGAVVFCPPSLVPSYPVRLCNKFDSQIISPIFLPHLDCLKVSSTVDLVPLFDALSLPKLCKLELDVVDAPVEVFDSIIDLPLVWEQILYFDIIHDVEVERDDAMKDVLQHLSPRAYVATNGEGLGGCNRDECFRDWSA